MDEQFKSFVILVSRMRDAQKEYFKYRTITALKASISLEHKVDKFIKENKDDNKQLSLNF